MKYYKVALIGALIASCSVSAKENNWSIGLAHNASDAGCEAYEATVVNPNWRGSCDKSAVGFRLGYQWIFNNNVALDLGYQDMGSVGWQGYYQPDPYFNAKYEASASGLDIAAVFGTQLQNESSFFGKLGLYSWNVDGVEKDQNGDIDYKASASGISLFFGAGYTYDWFTLEFNLYPSIGNKSKTGESDVTQLMLKASF